LKTKNPSGSYTNQHEYRFPHIRHRQERGVGNRSPEHLLTLSFRMKAIFTLCMVAFTIACNAQTLIPDEYTLEKTMYANQQSGKKSFDNITEKHVYLLSGDGIAKCTEELRKDKRTISVVTPPDKRTITVIVKKDSVPEAAWLQPIIENAGCRIESHTVELYHTKK
jgi:hypothetical protein